MNIEVNLNNLTEAEQEQLNALVKKANRPKRVWKPEFGEKYYCISADDGVGCYKYDCPFDTFNYVIGNCFKTKEEVEFTFERLKVIAEMKRCITEYDDIELDWSNSKQKKWYIRYCHRTNSIDIEYNLCTQFINEKSLYASSSEVLKAMIEEIGQDRIKRYYFGVV